jgi:hypothetical protein
MSKVTARENFGINCGFNGVCSAKLDLCGNGVDNHVLTITLKMRLKQILPPEKAPDMGGTLFNTLPWQAGEWESFQKGFTDAGSYWHRRCCLVPPAKESKFDYKPSFFAGPKYMPNIECNFNLQFVGDNSAHSTLDIAKISPADVQTFGSNSQRMNQGDVAKVKTDGTPAGQIAAAHEIGHLLGQPHIGELAKTSSCQKAISGEYDQLDDEERFLYRRGRNSMACYGLNSDIKGLNGNIMGLGMEFTEFNAVSWKTALAKVLWENDNFALNWGVVLRSYTGPRII